MANKKRTIRLILLKNCLIASSNPTGPIYLITDYLKEIILTWSTSDLQPPEFTYEIFCRCMEYAIEVNWGERIFSEVNEIK